MKKILLVLDGNHFSEGAFRMATFLNEHEQVLVTGVFLQAIDYRDIIGYSGMAGEAQVTLSPLETEENLIIRNMRYFENRCLHAGLEFRSHRDTDMFALQELQTETRFADLLILSGELFYENIGKEQPNDYLKKILRQTECPILLVPEDYTLPNKVVLAYDGKPDSVFAIKQFTYLFPHFYHWETTLITIEDEDVPLHYQELIEELAAKHFSNLTLEVISSVSERSFLKSINDKSETMLVAGAFGRSELSNLFKKSFLSEIIQQHKIPVFVAHK
jgi:nucleotide-binding universal stress UspA family protein